MAGVLIGHYHVAYFPALLGGVAFAVLLGVVVAAPALRLGGLSLALATLAIGLVADNVLFQWSWLAGPLQQGWAIPQPTIGPFHLSDDKTMAVVLAIIVIVVTLLIPNLQKSASGRMMSAVRTSESAASTSGISANAIKITLFAVSAGLAGFGGVLLVTVEQHVTNSTYTTVTGLTWLATVVLWGIRRPSAAIAAAMTGTLFTGVLSSGFHFSFISWSGTSSVWLPQVLFGLGAVTMAQNPDGILSLQEEQGFRRKQKKEAKRRHWRRPPPPLRHRCRPTGCPPWWVTAVPNSSQPRQPARPGSRSRTPRSASTRSALPTWRPRCSSISISDVRRGKLTASGGRQRCGQVDVVQGVGRPHGAAARAPSHSTARTSPKCRRIVGPRACCWRPSPAASSRAFPWRTT